MERLAILPEHGPGALARNARRLHASPPPPALEAIAQGYRVLFTAAAALIDTLAKASAEGRQEDKLKLFTVLRLLIVDEIGYLPIEPDRG